MKFEEEELVAVKQDFAEAAIPFDHIDEIDDVKITSKLSLAFSEHQLEVLMSRALS